MKIRFFVQPVNCMYQHDKRFWSRCSAMLRSQLYHLETTSHKTVADPCFVITKATSEPLRNVNWELT